MDNYKIKKFLSEGAMGKVYLVQKDGKKYAMKIDYILSKDDSIVQNELKFVEEVASKHPEQFIQLIGYDFIENCTEESPDIREWFAEEEKAWFRKVRSSGLCIRKVYSLIDTTLSNLPIENMTLEQRYSMIIQLLYINYLIQSAGFVHGDFHYGNIGVINVNKNKKVKIFDKMIPTFGNQFVAIDYGGVLHKSTISKTRKYQQRNISEWKHFNDMIIIDKSGILNGMINEKNLWDYVKKNNIQMKGFDEDFKLIMSQPEISIIRGITEISWLQWDLYKLLFTKRFQQLVFGENFKEKIPFICYISPADLIYAYSNFEDDELLIAYFVARLENV